MGDVIMITVMPSINEIFNLKRILTTRLDIAMLYGGKVAVMKEMEVITDELKETGLYPQVKTYNGKYYGIELIMENANAIAQQ